MCGSANPTAAGCYCNEDCFKFNDCCTDVCDGCSNLSGCGPCTPSCSGKTCGDDGCGGSCGECSPPLSSCMVGKCSSPDDCLTNCTKICGAGSVSCDTYCTFMVLLDPDGSMFECLEKTNCDPTCVIPFP
jgi:hypothetical protein